MFEDSEIKQDERITKNMCGGRIDEKKPEACSELIIFCNDDGSSGSPNIKGLSLRFMGEITVRKSFRCNDTWGIFPWNISFVHENSFLHAFCKPPRKELEPVRIFWGYLTFSANQTAQERRNGNEFCKALDLAFSFQGSPKMTKNQGLGHSFLKLFVTCNDSL